MTCGGGALATLAAQRVPTGCGPISFFVSFDHFISLSTCDSSPHGVFLAPRCGRHGGFMRCCAGGGGAVGSADAEVGRDLLDISSTPLSAVMGAGVARSFTHKLINILLQALRRRPAKLQIRY